MSNFFCSFSPTFHVIIQMYAECLWKKKERNDKKRKYDKRNEEVWLETVEICIDLFFFRSYVSSYQLAYEKDTHFHVPFLSMILYTCIYMHRHTFWLLSHFRFFFSLIVSKKKKGLHRRSHARSHTYIEFFEEKKKWGWSENVIREKTQTYSYIFAFRSFSRKDSTYVYAYDKEKN